jgi:hypothetical protein
MHNRMDQAIRWSWSAAMAVGAASWMTAATMDPPGESMAAPTSVVAAKDTVTARRGILDKGTRKPDSVVNRRVASAAARVAAADYDPTRPIDGTLGHVEKCDDFFIDSALSGLGFLPVIGSLFGDHDVPDAAWVLVQKGNLSLKKFRDATGVVALGSHVGDYPGGPVRADDPLRSDSPLGDESVVNFEDYPDVHDSHDLNFFLRLDNDPLHQGDLISTFGIDSRGLEPNEPGYAPDTLEVEWETGILTSERTGDGRFFPKWAWPLPGDRVWVNGYWIFDCGHTVKKPLPPADCPLGLPCSEKGLRSEIHPARAIASMRQQVAIPPGTSAPIPVTAADVFVHGRAGIITDLLECGGRVILDNRTCGSGETPRGRDSSDAGGPGHDIVHDHLGIPINEDFHFTMCAPPLPPGATSATGLFAWSPAPLAQDTVNIAPRLDVVDATGPCASGEFGPKQVLVTIPLDNTNVTPDAMYARHIYAGWLGAPVPLRHLRVTLDKMKLNIDLDDNFGGDDCECAWFWSSVDRAVDKTIRLSDVADDPEHHMNDFGNGDEMTFTNAVWDFMVPASESVTMRTFGFDGGVGEGSFDFKQDCLDDHFGHHDFGAHVDLGLTSFPDLCIGSLPFTRDPIDDPFDVLHKVFEPAELDALVGSWPATGSAELTLLSPLRCDVTYGFPTGVPQSATPRCNSTEELTRILNGRGFLVTRNVEVHQYELHLTIESIAMDSDGDGLSDADEVGIYHTDPLRADSDNDGLSDGAEVNTYHTDPLDADTDDDGLSDGAEVNTYHTNPLDADSDDDGLNDGVEVSVGTNPLDADSDDDGIPDGRDPQFLLNAVNALSADAFRASGNRTSLLDRLGAIERLIAGGSVTQAIRELRSLRTRMDGCGVAADGDDWIVDCAAQIRMQGLIDLLITNLGG